MGQYSQARSVVLETAKRLAQRGMFIGTGGNISALVEGEQKIAITPSGMDYLTMKAEDICICDFSCGVVDGAFKPSIETGLHLAVYKKRPDVNAIIHTHQVAASTFAVLGMPIPPMFDEQVFNLGPVVDVVPYGMSGSAELLNNVAAAVENMCNAFILKNHGVLLLGIDMDEAERNVGLLEKTASVYLSALSTGREISLLEPSVADFIFLLLKDRLNKEVMKKNSNGGEK